MRQMVCTQMKIGFENGLSHLRSRRCGRLLILTRPTRQAAEKKARELDDMGCFEVELVEEPDAEAA